MYFKGIQIHGYIIYVHKYCCICYLHTTWERSMVVVVHGDDDMAMRMAISMRTMVTTRRRQKSCFFVPAPQGHIIILVILPGAYSASWRAEISCCGRAIKPYHQCSHGRSSSAATTFSSASPSHGTVHALSLTPPAWQVIRKIRRARDSPVFTFFDVCMLPDKLGRLVSFEILVQH